MQVSAGGGTVVRGSPFGGIDRLGDAEIERQLRDDLPPQAEVRAASETVNGRDGIGTEHIVLVAVNAVVPLASIEALEPKMEG